MQNICLAGGLLRIGEEAGDQAGEALVHFVDGLRAVRDNHGKRRAAWWASVKVPSTRARRNRTGTHLKRLLHERRLHRQWAVADRRFDLRAGARRHLKAEALFVRASKLLVQHHRHGDELCRDAWKISERPAL